MNVSNAAGNRSLCRTLPVAVVDLAPYGHAGAGALAGAATAETASPKEKESAFVSTTVLVGGTCASLATPRERLRGAAIVPDSITADDPGRFPEDRSRHAPIRFATRRRTVSVGATVQS